MKIVKRKYINNKLFKNITLVYEQQTFVTIVIA